MASDDIKKTTLTWFIIFGLMVLAVPITFFIGLEVCGWSGRSCDNTSMDIMSLFLWAEVIIGVFSLLAGIVSVFRK